MPTHPRWLLLLHQLPPRPAYLRVKVWRRLQSLGAVAIKNSAYVLPDGERSREDLEWLLREIRDGGGDAILCRMSLLDGLRDDEVEALFRSARETEYTEVRSEARALLAALPDEGDLPAGRGAEVQAQAARLRKRLAAVAATDFFTAVGRTGAEDAVARLEARLRPAASDGPVDRGGGASLDLAQRGRTWVTRRGVHVDRIASAWLIRRFVDPRARFEFVAGRRYRPAPGELRFDMFEAEFTHVGDRCTFEVLLDAAGLEDRALRRIAELVHDIDLKDSKFEHEETAGLARLIAGVVASHREDERRLERGGALLDDLYEGLRREGLGTGRARAPRASGGSGRGRERAGKATRLGGGRTGAAVPKEKRREARRTKGRRS